MPSGLIYHDAPASPTENPTTTAAALQDAVGKAQGGVLKLGKGVWRLPHSIEIPSNITIEGSGYDTVIELQPEGWNVNRLNGASTNTTRNYGAFTFYHVSNCRVTGVRFRGSMDTVFSPPPATISGYELSPNHIQIEESNRLRFDGCWFEDSHYASVWSAGDFRNNRDIQFSGCIFYNCSYLSPTDGAVTYYGGVGGAGTVQLNAVNSSVVNCVFRQCGGPIILTGNHLSAVGNTIDQWLGSGVFIGDQGQVKNINVTGNNFYTDVTSASFGDIYCIQTLAGTADVTLNNSIAPGRYPINLSGNTIHISLSNNNVAYSSGGKSIAALALQDADVLAVGNYIEYSFETAVTSLANMSGIQLSASGQNPHYSLVGNLVKYRTPWENDPSTWSSGTTYAANAIARYGVYTYKSLQASNTNHQPDVSPTYWQPQWTGNARGMIAIPGSKTMHVMSSGNGFMGATAAWDFFADGGSGERLVVHQLGDYADVGAQRTGGTMAQYNVPVYAAMDTSVGGGTNYALSPLVLPLLPSASAAGDYGLAIDSSGGIKRGNAAFLTAQAAWDPGSIADGASTSTTVTVTGATSQDQVAVTHDSIGAVDVIISGFVQSANTVRVVLTNKTGGNFNLGNGTLFIKVLKI